MDPFEIPEKFFRVANVNGGQKKIGNTRSNHVISLEKITKSEIVVNMNQRLRRLFVIDCSDTLFQILDSAVILTRKIDFVNCHNVTLCLDEVDLRFCSFFNCSGITVQTGDSETLIENFRFYWHNCSGENKVERTIIRPGINPNEHFVCPVVTVASYVVDLKDGVTESCLVDGKALSTVLSMNETENTRNSDSVLEEIRELEENNQVFDNMPVSELERLYKAEGAEEEDPLDVFKEGVKQIAAAIRKARHVVVYTGAGISTAAKLPDYRGPAGVWTMRARGILPGGKMSLGEAQPTYAHYALTHLLKLGLVKHITSTNLDGLHRRSGATASQMSELHGNCYREFCEKCDAEHFRSFDTLPTRQDRWTHHTGRHCDFCGGMLKDSIIHFTENIRPDEWNSAVFNARQSDVAIVLGTSMNVQPAASLPDKCLVNGGQLFIVNLQRTPYDEFASIKLHAKTDDFMHALMMELNEPSFDTTYDLCVVMFEKETAAERSRRIKLVAGAVAAVAALVSVGVAVWKRRHVQ